MSAHGHGSKPSSNFIEEEHEPEAHDEEAWLVSYADMMTLLFGFFAMLFTYATFDDDPNLVKVRKELARFFGGTTVAQVSKTRAKEVRTSPSPAAKSSVKAIAEDTPDRKTPAAGGPSPGPKVGEAQGGPLVGKGESVQDKNAASSEPPKEGMTEATSGTAADASRNALPMVSAADMKWTDDGFELAFITSLTFDTGGSDLTPEARSSLRILADLIREVTPEGKLPQIRIEGHTDDNPLSAGGKSPFKSNWELSAARAGVIAQFFQSLGFPGSTLSAAGYGSTRPMAPDRTPAGVPISENQAMNRRVVIKVVLPKDGEQEAVSKLGQLLKTAADDVPVAAPESH